MDSMVNLDGWALDGWSRSLGSDLPIGHGLLFGFGRPKLLPPRLAGCMLVVIHSPEPERMRQRFDLERDPFILGAGAHDHGVLDDGLTEDRHLRLEVREEGGKPAWWVRDQSDSGLAVNDAPCREAPLKSGDRIEIGRSVLAFFENDAEYREVSHWITVQDGLLQIFNRTYLDMALAREHLRARERGRRFSVVAFRIDRQQTLVELHGERVMNRVMQELARRIEAHLTVDQTFCRVEDDQFVIVMPETSASYALARGHVIRAEVGRVPMQLAERSCQLTVSVGVAQLEPSDQSHSPLDRALLGVERAANAGGNRVIEL